MWGESNGIGSLSQETPPRLTPSSHRLGADTSSHLLLPLLWVVVGGEASSSMAARPQIHVKMEGLGPGVSTFLFLFFF